MSVLLDTNVFYWAVTDADRLTGNVRGFLSSSDEQVLVSPLLHYELSQKHARGKLELALPSRKFVRLGMEQLRADELPLRLKHTGWSDTIGWHHKDPFDRLLALQALGEGIPIVSSDEIFELYGIRRIW